MAFIGEVPTQFWTLVSPAAKARREARRKTFPHWRRTSGLEISKSSLVRFSLDIFVVDWAGRRLTARVASTWIAYASLLTVPGTCRTQRLEHRLARRIADFP